MGDLRYQHSYERVRDAPNRMALLRSLPDDEVIAALGGASEGKDPLLANVLATEAQNRMQRAKRVVESVTDAIVAFDRAGRIVLLNPAAERAIGWLTEEVLGREATDVIQIAFPGSREGEAGVEALLDPLRSGQRVHLPAARVQGKDGAAFHASVSGVPVLVEGEVTGAVVVFHAPAPSSSPDRVPRTPPVGFPHAEPGFRRNP